MVMPKFTVGASADALALRKEVFIDEQGYDYDEDEFDASCWSLVVYLDGVAIAAGRLLEIDPETYRIGRVCVKKELRRQKVGSYTMKFLFTKARELGARKVIVHAQADKLAFYRGLGFREIDGEVFLEDGTPHVAMVRPLLRKARKRK